MVEVKTIGSSGQISIGKEHAGRTVTVDQIEDGVWLIKVARVVPENEMWLHSAPTSGNLDRALAWAKGNPPSESNLERIATKLKKAR